jgi:hypothetical protein
MSNRTEKGGRVLCSEETKSTIRACVAVYYLVGLEFQVCGGVLHSILRSLGVYLVGNRRILHSRMI